MIDPTDTLRQELLQNEEEYRNLYEQHQEFERRLELLQNKSLFSEEDDLEEKRIKRQKLFLKDRMEAIVRAHRDATVSA